MFFGASARSFYQGCWRTRWLWIRSLHGWRIWGYQRRGVGRYHSGQCKESLWDCFPQLQKYQNFQNISFWFKGILPYSQTALVTPQKTIIALTGLCLVYFYCCIVLLCAALLFPVSVKFVAVAGGVKCKKKYVFAFSACDIWHRSLNSDDQKQVVLQVKKCIGIILHLVPNSFSL